ncbi:hypothetical protein BDZ45DRAFT_87540 [Acephala macrosclerotiorum]|nr:hypothetical protein BDZ45DRAFT_87540 [Acephala macrosclerotiorum]
MHEFVLLRLQCVARVAGQTISESLLVFKMFVQTMYQKRNHDLNLQIVDVGAIRQWDTQSGLPTTKQRAAVIG